MINKKMILLTIFLISIFAISAVNAAENVTQETVSIDEPANVEDSTNEVISTENQNDNVVSATHYSFTQLNSEINGNSNRDIYLKSNYAFKPGTDDQYKEGITISRSITVHGNGFTLDGANAARIFRVNDESGFNRSNVKIVFMDIIFINGNAEYSGGAIKFCDVAMNCTFINNHGSWGGAISEGNAINCTFTNNTARYGGAISEGYAINCTFTNNTSIYEGGAISKGDAVNCTFTNNTSNSEGGAIYYGDVKYCTFINNKAKKGGAIYNNLHGFALNCTFTNNKAEENGGAVYNGDIINCTFANNTAKNGGATYRCDAYTCEFTNNNAQEYGGAMYGDECYYKDSATNCIFIGNYAKNGGAVYMVNVNYSDFIANSATEKGGAMYNGTGVYCYFADNNATAGGDDTYSSELLKYATKLSAPSSMNAIYNDDKYLLISLKDQYDNLFIGYEVSVIIDGKTTTVYTEEDGQARMSTMDLVPGTHDVKITFEGDSNFDKSTTTSKVIIKKATPKLTATKKTFKKSVKTKKYTVSLKDNWNEAIKNAKVTLKIKGKTYKATTNSKGKATFKIKKLTKKGKFKATVIFAGNPYYNSISVKTQIKIR